MSGISKLRIVDTQGEAMTCSVSGHDRQIEKELVRCVANEVNAFYKKAKAEGFVSHHFIRDKDVNVNVFEDEDERLWIDLTSSTGKHVKTEIDTEDNPELAADAREIIELVRDIWAKHDHSTHKHARTDSRGKSRTALHEHLPHRSKARSRLDERLRAAKTSKTTDPHFKQNKRVRDAISQAIDYCDEADAILEKAKLGRPTIGAATRLTDKITAHKKVMARLSQTLDPLNPNRSDLEKLGVQLEQKVTALESLSARKQDIKTFAEIYTELNDIAKKFDASDDELGETPGLVKEFQEKCDDLCGRFPDAVKGINALQRLTYFYAHGLDPQFKDERLRNREGEWLFSSSDEANKFPNKARGTAIQFALLHNFAGLMGLMTADNIETFREIFDTLPPEAQRDILIKFAEVRDISIRDKASKREVDQIVERLRIDFLGDPKTGDFPLSPLDSEPRREAINLWIQEKLNEMHGIVIRGLLHDNDKLRRELKELGEERDLLNEGLDEARDNLRQAELRHKRTIEELRLQLGEENEEAIAEALRLKELELSDAHRLATEKLRRELGLEKDRAIEDAIQKLALRLGSEKDEALEQLRQQLGEENEEAIAEALRNKERQLNEAHRLATEKLRRELGVEKDHAIEDALRKQALRLGSEKNEALEQLRQQLGEENEEAIAEALRNKERQLNEAHALATQELRQQLDLEKDRAVELALHEQASHHEDDKERALSKLRQELEKAFEQRLKRALDEQARALAKEKLRALKELHADVENRTRENERLRKTLFDLEEQTKSGIDLKLQQANKLLAESEAHVHLLGQDLDRARERIAFLEQQLKEQQKVAVVATGEMGTQTGEDNEVEVDLSDRGISVLSPVLDQRVIGVSEIDELDLNEDAFGLLSDAVKEGRIDMLLEVQNESTLQNAPAALLTRLQKNPDDVERIYNLAIYVAHSNPAIFQNEILASTIQNWLMFRVAQPAMHPEELRKLNTLVEAFNAADLQEMARVTGSAIQKIEAMQHILSPGRTGTLDQRWKWAAQALTKLDKGSEQSDVERIFAIKLRNALGAAAEIYSGPIVNPAASRRDGTIQHLNLEEQLCRERGRLSVDSRGKKAAYAYFTGPLYQKEYGSWFADADARERTILQLIGECSDFRTWHDVNLAQIEVQVDEVEVSDQLLVPEPLPNSATLESLEREYAEARQGLIDNRVVRIAAIEQEITNRLSALTGLHPNDPKLSAPLVIDQVLNHRLPPVLDNVLCQDDGREFLILAQLVYWHSALSHWNDQLPNPRAQQFKFAIPSDWSWLMERGAATLTDQADRLVTITNHLIHHPKLQGSPLTPFQVKWAEKLAKLLLQKEPSAIYDEAGAGKTDTADFTLGLLQDVFQGEELPEVHWLTPFAPKSEVPGAVIPGVTMHQLPKFSGKIEVLVSTAHAVVLVDEGHKLVPESDDLMNPETGHVSIVLKTPEEDEIPVQWLSMTATPVVPAIPLEMEQEFSGRTIEFYSSKIRKLSPKLEQLLKRREENLPALKVATKKARIRDQVTAVQEHLENIRRFHAAHRDLINILPKSVETWMDSVIQESRKLYKLIPARETDSAYREGLTKLFSRQSGREGSAIKLKRLLRHLLGHSVDKAVREQEAIVRVKRNDPEALAKLRQLKEEQRRIHGLIDPIIENLEALEATLVTHSSEIQGPYVEDDFTRPIDEIQGLLKFYHEKVEKLQGRNLTIERFQKTREELGLQGRTPSPMQMLELGFTEEQAFAMTLPAKRAEHFATVNYHQAALKTFNPGNVGASLDIAREQLEDANAPALQLIFPGVRFNAENFTDDFLGSIVQRFAGKEVHMLYHDSHSAEHRGKDILKIYGADGALVATHILENLEQARVLIAQRDIADAVNIMLYDSTNQQGGDFGAFSRVSAERPIDQIVFYDLTDNEARDPSLLSTANDAYQALRRRRGVSARPPVLLASLPKVKFFDAVNRQQAIAERYHAAGVAANQIARRLLKIAARTEDPNYSLKEKSIEQVRVDVARMKQLPKLAKAVDLTERIREQLLTGRHDSEELAQLEELVNEARVRRDDPVLAAKIAHTGAKMDFYARWVREIR